MILLNVPQELLLWHAESADPFQFGDYDMLEPADTPSGQGLVCQHEFLERALRAIPRAEVNQSQIAAMLYYPVARLVQRFDVGHKARLVARGV